MYEKSGIRRLLLESSTYGVPSYNSNVCIVLLCCRGAFKTRAAKIEKAVGAKAMVEINKEKPGRGNFVVRVDGQVIVELLAMVSATCLLYYGVTWNALFPQWLSGSVLLILQKRPFPPLKSLDMDETIEKVINAIS